MQPLGVGFSFNGIHCFDMNVQLGNNEPEMHALTADVKYASESVDGYDGAYPIGSTVGPREFNLKLICEDFTERDLARVAEWFKRDAYGPLVFDHKPYKYYNVRVTSELTPPMYPGFDAQRHQFLYSGTLSVKLTAFTPYAYAVAEVLEKYPDIGELLPTVNGGTGIVSKSMRPKQRFTNIAGDTSFLLLNQGTAEAKCDVTLSGRGINNSVTIVNRTTGQRFTITAPDDAPHTYCVSAFYSRTTEALPSGQEVMADQAKSGGFISLMPCGNVYRDGLVTSVQGATILQYDSDTSLDMVGKHLYVDSAWRRITSVGDRILTVQEPMPSSRSGFTTILSMNELEVLPNGAQIDAMQFEFRDTFY